MPKKIEMKEWMRLVIAFVLGVAVTILVMQSMGGGEMMRGYLTLPTSTTSTTVKPATTTTTTTKPATVDTDLSESLIRLPSGERIRSTSDDDPGLP